MANSRFTDPWSWSKLEKYRTCPQQFKYVVVEKRREPESPAFAHGNEVHKAIENYLNGWKPALALDLAAPWKLRLEKLKALKPLTEAAWGVTAKWEPLKNWLDPRTWLRAKSDATYLQGIGDDELNLIDFKSGKYRVPSQDQVELYAIVGHVFHPQVARVRASFWFVEQDSVPHEEVYKAADLIKLRRKYEKESSKFYKDKAFAPTPGQHCRWCHFSRQKGGPCQY